MIFDDTNLPSRLRPYPVKQIEVKEFRPKQIALLSKSVMLDDMGPAVEAMGQVLVNLDVGDLTTGDFFFLLTWQRLHALKRNPVMAQWECPGAMFADREDGQRFSARDIKTLVENWEAADDETRTQMKDPNEVILDGYVCSHGNYQKLEFNEFQSVFLDENLVLDERLDFPRCSTLAEFVKLQRDPDYGMLAEAAQWIKGFGTLQQRIQRLLDSEDNDLFEVACETSRDVQHGIRRTVTKACDACGHKHALNFVVDPKAFFL